MEKSFLPFLLGLAGVVGVACAFATGENEDTEPNDADDVVVVGEVDLAERAEILRNHFRRMTPGDFPIVQDVGTWPAAWEEFDPVWDSAPATRDLATWLVPFSVERIGLATIIRDANGTLLWNGTTDFAKDESEDVTLTGALMDESDWALWEAARAEIERRLSDGDGLRDGEGGGDPSNGVFGLRFTNMWVDTNEDYHFDFAWESNGEVQVFCRAMHYECWTNYGVVWTNDENEVVTNDVVHWNQVPGERFNGTSDTWNLIGVATVTNGSGSITDTNHVPEYDRVRFYAAAELVDTDGDGLTDGEEWLVSHTSSALFDTDGDGLGDKDDPGPSSSNVFWKVETTNTLACQIGLDDCLSNSPAQSIDSWIVIGAAPTSNSIVGDVKISGYVDDAIQVDGTGVDFERSPQSFSDRSIVAEMADKQSRQFCLELWDYPQADYAGPNEVRLGDANGNPFRVVWEWWTPMYLTGPDFVRVGETAQFSASGAAGGEFAWSVEGSAASINQSGLLTAITSGVVTVTATNTISGCSVSKDVTLFELHAVSVEASEESGLATLHCQVLPVSAILPQIDFTGPWGTTTSHDVGGNFSFSFDQHDIPDGASEMTLSFGSCNESVSISRENVTKGPTLEVVVAIVAVDDREFVQYPISHWLTEVYSRITYSIPLSSNAHTLFLGASHVTLEVNYPLTIDLASELHRYHDSRGTHKAQSMTLYTGGPTLPPTTDYRKYYDSSDDSFFIPGIGLEGISQLDTIKLGDDIPISLLNEDNNLELE